MYQSNFCGARNTGDIRIPQDGNKEMVSAACWAHALIVHVSDCGLSPSPLFAGKQRIAKRDDGKVNNF
jgi:hypothetical protein